MALQLVAVGMIIDEKQKDYIPLQEQMSTKSRWTLKETKMFFSCKYFSDKTAGREKTCYSMKFAGGIFDFRKNDFFFPLLELALSCEFWRSFFFTDTGAVRKVSSIINILLLHQLRQVQGFPLCVQNCLQGAQSPALSWHCAAQGRSTEQSQMYVLHLERVLPLQKLLVLSLRPLKQHSRRVRS